MRNLFVITLIATAMFNVAQAAEWETITPSDSLEGWRVLSGEWRVEDGVVIAKATKDENGWLLYEAREFADVEIELEFRTPTPTNGGVQLRSHWLPRMPLEEGETVNDAPRQMHGYQVNVETRQRLGTGIIMEENGRGYLAEPAMEAAKTLKQKDWNTMRIVARGNRIEVYHHDVLACKVEDDAFLDGYIALQLFPFQSEDAVTEMEYRNIKVKDYGREGNWRALFNGKDFDGWKKWGEEDWSVEEGIIMGRSGPKKSEGYLATEENFKDFHVRGGFKILGDGNYGLFYHSTIKLREKDGYPLISGLQGEVEPGFPGSSGWVYESYKRGWLVKPDHTTMPSVALRPDEWNEIEIRTRGNHVTTWINGIQVLDLEDKGQQLFEGSFALQLHSGGADGISWKDLYVLD